MKALCAILILLTAQLGARADGLPDEMLKCRGIREDSSRLQCFDALARGEITAPVPAYKPPPASAVSPESADQDPHADADAQSRKDSYNRVRDAFLTSVKRIYFAVGCKALQSDARVGALIGAQARLLSEEETRLRIMDTTLERLMRSAAGEGKQQASEPGACLYWRDHPEAVSLIRRQAEDALEP
jgi:hypothetical protein